MPRLLTLWFEVCALDPEIPVRKALRGQGNTTSRVTAASDLSKTQYSCTAIVQTAMTEVPPYMWYTCMPQLMSRVGHPKDEVVAVVSQALVNIISAHPHQALWQVRKKLIYLYLSVYFIRCDFNLRLILSNTLLYFAPRIRYRVCPYR